MVQQPLVPSPSSSSFSDGKLQLHISKLTERVETLETEVKSVKSDTSELLDIFNGTKVAAKVFVRLGKWLKWLGGIAVAIVGIYKAIQLIKTGEL